MMHIHKKVFALMMALMMVFSCVGVAQATEVPEETALVAEENVAVPAATKAIGITWQYSNGEFRNSAVSLFTSTKTGTVRCVFGGVPLDGVADGTITITLYAKNWLNQFVELDSCTIPADGEVYTSYMDAKIYEGDSCKVTITATSTKTMVVSGGIGAY